MTNLSISGFEREVTRRKQIRGVLRKNEEQSRSIIKGLVDTSFDGVVIHQDGVIKTVNQAFAAMYGYTVEELTGLNAAGLTPPGQRELVAARMAEGDEARYETLGLRKDGSYIDIEVSLRNCLYAGRPCWLAAVRDLTESKRSEKALRATGERYRLLFERNLSGVCRATLNGRILDCNESFARIFGFEGKEEVRSAGTLGLYGRSTDRKNFLRRLRVHHTLNNLELCLRRKDGSPVWVLGNASLVEDDEGELTVIEGIWLDITERKLAEEDLKSSREMLRALSTELQIVREKERTHIAREIHDQLGQVLTRLKIDLSLIADDLPEEGRHLRARMTAMSNLFDATIQNVRRICGQLRPSALDHLGLTAAIEEELSEWRDRTGIEYAFDSCGPDFDLDPECSTAIFRILQETLTNVARHTSATRVDIRLSNKGGFIYLTISDNGNGISMDQVYDPRSLGLIGMRERARQWGGELDIERGSEGGTVIALLVPLARLGEATGFDD